jgi:hypothetical protein|tara:strand:+ start:688 stop:936 length:249 start_codon:yes stop_codon:yes gene_type:complete
MKHLLEFFTTLYALTLFTFKSLYILISDSMKQEAETYKEEREAQKKQGEKRKREDKERRAEDIRGEMMSRKKNVKNEGKKKG